MTPPEDTTRTRRAEGADPRRRAAGAWPLLVAAVAFVAYAPSLANGFALDDVTAVQGDERLSGAGGLTALVLEPYLRNVPPQRSPYRPVTTVSYALSWRAGGGAPWAFHLFNVLAHVAACLLLLAFLTRIGGGATAAGVAATLFAVHPVHVEAVANVVGRADVLVTVFCLVGVLIHLARGLPSWVRIAGVCVAYLLALGSKESGYVLPLLLVLVETVRPIEAGSEVSSLRAALGRALRDWPLYAAMTVTMAAYLLVRRSVLGGVVHLDVAAYIAILPEWLRVTTAVANLAEVARLLVFPGDLSWDYGPAVLEPAGPGDLRFWSGVLVVVLASTLALVAVRAGSGGRWAFAGLAWIAAAFMLLSNLIVPLPIWLAERTLYLPSVGLAMLCVAALKGLARRGVPASSRSVIGVALALTLLGGWHSWRYSRAWADNDTVMADFAERHPESLQAQSWVGLRLVEAGEIERGIEWLGRAAALNPNEVTTRLDYARALLLAGRNDEADEQLRPIPLGLHPSVSVFRAQSLIFRDRPEEALRVVEEGLRLFPDDVRLREQRRQLTDDGGA